MPPHCRCACDAPTARVPGRTLLSSTGPLPLLQRQGCSPRLNADSCFRRCRPLLRFGLAFSVGLDYFVAPDRDKSVVGTSRHQERLRLPENVGGQDAAGS